ncbi:MAG: hypothetical protein ACE5HE_15035, partial [Phycisphaerae bacterium]
IMILSACQFFLLITGSPEVDWLPSAWPTMLILIIFCMVCRVAIPSLEKALLRKRIGSEDCEICLECGYILKGLASGGRCPECGIVFDRAGTREEWTSWFQSSPMWSGACRRPTEQAAG